jgi:multiple sugar transport system ATP-binding protein
MASIQLKRLNKHYGKMHHAVRDLNLEIADKEFVALVGPSGCGKSTTLRMIAGLEEITSGDIEIGNRVVNTLPPKDRDVAMVFQNYALYQHMSVYDNLAFGLRNRKVPAPQIAKEIERAASILGLSDLMQRRPRQLSGGQQQRVALGRCLVRNPSVFLFDEPLSNLDAKLRAQMRAEIKHLRQRVPTTSVFVTHDQVEAMTLGDRVVVMKDGTIQQAGTPLEVYSKPANRFVAGFIGAPMMNFIDVSFRSEADTIYMCASTWEIPLDVEPQLKARLRERASAVLGIRPEHLLLGDNGACRATVQNIDQLGSEMHLELDLDGDMVTAARVAPERQVQRGDGIRFDIDLARAHFFDALSGEAIR